MEKTPKPYGTWSSPISEEMLAGSLNLIDVQWADDGETLVWAERHDGFTSLMVRRPGQAPRRLNDSINIRGGCGYGGGEFALRGDSVVFAADDGRLYAAHLDTGLPRPITPPWGAVASPAISHDGEWVAFVHSHQDVDRIGLVDIGGTHWPTIAAQGADFYMQPTFQPDDRRLLWVAWDHPAMPWMATRVEAAHLSLDDGTPSVGDTQILYGADDPRDIARQQPLFSPTGTHLAHLSDQSGRWQVIVEDLSTGQTTALSDPLRDVGGPAWIQGLRYYAWEPSGDSVLAISSDLGASRIDRLPLNGAHEPTGLFNDYTHLSQLSLAPSGHVACLAESSLCPPRVVSATAGKTHIERFSSSERLGPDDLAVVKPVSWSTGTAGPIETVHGLYYPPTNATQRGTGRPPALVMIHGGPTSQRTQRFEARNQYFASRGFAVLDVNYRGSTGYGRQYMEALFGQWGVVDVEDAVGGARFLVDEGLAAKDQLVIMGGSAGGYTVLQTLTTHPGVFKAGVCLYGISDLFALQMGTHKFEAHYNDTLIGILPEDAETFRARSPIFRAEAIQDRLAIYHGAKDRVVPPDQAEAIADSLRRRGVDLLHHVYEDEGHGWRRTDTIKHFHRSLLDFLQRHVIFG